MTAARLASSLRDPVPLRHGVIADCEGTEGRLLATSFRRVHQAVRAPRG